VPHQPQLPQLPEVQPEHELPPPEDTSPPPVPPLTAADTLPSYKRLMSAPPQSGQRTHDLSSLRDAFISNFFLHFSQ